MRKYFIIRVGVISIMTLAFLPLCVNGVWAAKKEGKTEPQASKSEEDMLKEKKDKAEALMAKMDAIGRAESFSMMADETLKDLDAAAKTTNTNQIVYLARRYERVLEAARFNVFLADRQGKDIKATMDSVENLSQKGNAALKAIAAGAPPDTREAIERARATAEKSRSVLYQRLLDKYRLAGASGVSAPSIPNAVSAPVSSPKTVNMPPRLPNLPKTKAANVAAAVPKIPPTVPPTTAAPREETLETASTKTEGAVASDSSKGATAVISQPDGKEQPKSKTAEPKPAAEESKKSFWKGWWGKK